MFDIAIVGNSLVSSSLVRLLNQQFPNLKIAIIDKVAHVHIGNNRAIALAPSSVELFKLIEVWDQLELNAGRIHNISLGVKTSEDASFAFQDDRNALGWNVLNGDLHTALQSKPANTHCTTYFLGKEVIDINVHSSHAVVALEGGQEILCRLLIGADGRNSAVREKLTKTRTFNYDQTAITGTVQHTLAHNNIAYEYFLPQGALAFIPLKNECSSTLVWSIKNSMYTEDVAVLNRVLSGLMKKQLGDISIQFSVSGYPLSAKMAMPRYGHRWVLLGDAANTLHPVAGQGLNLALRDVAALSNHLRNQLAVGLDIGSETFLRRYSDSRRLDRHGLLGVTHMSAKYFTTKSYALTCLLKGGLKTLKHFPVLSEALSSAARNGI